MALALPRAERDTARAMSQENVEIVKVAYEVFAREGLDRFMTHFSDDVEYRVLAGADDLVHGPCHGKDAVRAYFQDWIDMFDGFWQQLVELIDAGGDTVFTAERYGGRARLSGVETDSANWTVFTIREGKIAGGAEYETREQALEAAGLSE
jgi:ketosteroid isomerase-like protein